MWESLTSKLQENESPTRGFSELVTIWGGEGTTNATTNHSWSTVDRDPVIRNDAASQSRYLQQLAVRTKIKTSKVLPQ